MSQINKLKILLGIKLDDVSDDELLQLLLDSAEADILAETNRKTIPPGLLDAQIQLATIKYNRLGIEGEQGHTEGGIARTIYVLNEDAPASLRRKINQYRLVKLVGYL